MILKYTWHGAMLEAVDLARVTSRRHAVRRLVPPGARRMWWVVMPAGPIA
jgi:hypothetical protein